MRHPIYTGLIAGAVAMAGLQAKPWAILGAALFSLGFALKAKVEERFLEKEIGGYDGLPPARVDDRATAEDSLAAAAVIYLRRAAMRLWSSAKPRRIAMPVKITVTKNGPYQLSGDLAELELHDAGGNA